MTVGERLRRHAAERPDARAFTFLADGEGAELSIGFGELDLRARAVAAELQRLAAPGERALLLHPAGIELVVALMGCIYANVVAVPVPAHFHDPRRLQRTASRLVAIAEDAEAALVLTSAQVRALAPALPARAWLDTDAIPLERAAAWREPAVGPDDLVFLQYSSGSTGRPKGVMVAHANLDHNVAAIRAAFGHDASTVGVSWLPAYHDMGLVADVLQPIATGHHMVFMSPFDWIARPRRWLEAIAKYRATTSGAPNFAYALLASRVDAGDLDLSSWRVAYNCAEPVTAEAIERFAATFAPCGFRREAFLPYLGMAEATLMVTAGDRDAPPVYVDGQVGCGRSLPDQQLVIVDPESGVPCAEGLIGEIWVAGPSVARGYWRRPEESAATFGARLPDGRGPFLRTGDMGLLHGGELVVAGRLKDLVIIQGQNHWPQDLERTAEAAHPAVRPGCSAAFSIDGPAGERLVLMAEVADDADHAEVAAAVRAELAEEHQLVAEAVVLLAPGAIAKTSSGKVQRRACKERYMARELRAIFGELLGTSELDASFLALGGHSLLATRLAARVRERLGVELPLHGLFGAGTLGEVVARLNAFDRAVLPPLVPSPRAGPAPLSFAQARMAFLDALNPGGSQYVMSVALRLRGALDAARLERALATIVARHELLAERQGETPFRLMGARDARFDLATGPLFRAALERLAPDDHRLWLDMHHVVADGWSLGVIARELGALYAGEALPPLAVQYADFAAWQRGWLRGELLEAQLAHWRARLAGAPDELVMPTDRPRGAAVGGASLSFALSPALTARLEAFAREHGATLFMVGLALFQALLHRWSRAQELCVGTPIANRRAPELEPLVGFFANTLVLRADLAAAPTFAALLRQTRERCLDAYAHQDLPFERLVEALAPPRRAGRHPLFQAMFVLQEPPGWALAGLTVEPEPVAAFEAKFDLLLELTPAADGLRGRLEYATGLWDASTAARLAEHFVLLAEAVLAEPDTRLGALPLPGLPAAPTPAAVVEAPPGPRGPQAVEARIRGLFEEVLAELGVPRVAAEDSFFDLGGHSLLATRLAARIREAFQVELPLRTLFEAPSPAALAAIVAERAGPTLADAPRGPLVPRLSYAQERLWFMDRLLPESALFTHAAVFRIDGELDPARLRRALEALVERHEALRTTFVVGPAGEPQPVVVEPTGDILVELDGPADALDRWAGEKLPLDQAPPLRARVLRTGSEQAVLAITVHHIAVDGWSMALLLRELGELYGGAAAAPPPRSYLEYVAWQRDQLEGEVFAGQLARWKARLAGAPAMLALPTDRPRPPLQRHRGRKHVFVLPAELRERAWAFAAREGVTPFMLLLAVFQLLCSRWSGQTNLCVGVPFANRRLAAFEPIVGLFVNTLVLRADLAGAPAFRAFLQQVKERCLDADADQDLPFEKLVEALNPERSTSRHPLYQVMFTLQEAASSTLALPGLVVEPIEADGGTSKLDLSLDLLMGEAGLVGRLEYDTDLFDQATIARFVAHYERLLRAALAEPDAPVDALDMLDAAERRLLISGWNDTAASRAGAACIHRLIEQQVARTPEAIAIDFEGETLSYAALNAAANRLAHRLRALGVGPDVPVGLCAERSAHFVPAVLAVLKAGGAYVPLDPTWPAERVRFMREDSGAPLVLADARGAALFPDALRLDLPAAWADEPASDPESGVGLEHLVSIIYTSGSTGTPKGVLNRHLGVYNHLTYRQAAYRMTPTDRVMQKTSLNFDGSVWELFWPLSVGARLHVAPPALQQDAEGLCDFVRRHGISMIDFVPSMLHEVLATGRLADCPSLRRYFVGGELMSAALRDAFFEQVPHAELTHGYGPTETTVSVLYHDCARGETYPGVPIGRPIANTWVYVLDPAMRLVPVGVAGELHIGGHGLARGYHARPALTAERFVSDPFRPGERLYKSGDMARWLPDGRIEFLGRVDDQVKIRGFRIEPGEIEAVLGRHPEAGEVVVVVREDRPGDRRLVAYLVPRPGAAPAPAALRAWLAARLPDHMVPAAIVTLARIPRLPNEKVDRRALPAPTWGRAAAEDDAEPTTPEQAVLCALFAEVLGVPMVGIHDDFFELGGHSLLATRLVARARERLGVELPLRRLFEAPTPAGLAEAAAAARGPVLPPIVPVAPGAPLALSFAQERLWFIDRLEPDNALYNIAAAWRLDGPLDAARLASALGALLALHEGLRTRFEVRDGRPYQVVEPPGGFVLGELDLTGLAEPMAEALRLAREEADRPFDLARGPLARARLLRLAPDAHVLSLVLHHVVSDGWSWRVMLQDLAALYRGEAPPAPATRYVDFAAWQRAQLAGPAMAAQSAYWRGRLAGAPELSALPTDRPRPAIQRYRGAWLERRLAPALVERLRELARARGVTPFMLLLAAFQVLLARWSGQADVCVGVPIANRRHAQLERVIGFFVNTLVLRADLADGPAFGTFLRQVQARCLEAYAHQDLPFEKLVEELNPRRSLSWHPLFQTLFVLQEHGAEGPALAGTTCTPLALGSLRSRFDLALELLPEPDGGLRARVEYDTDLFDEATIARFAGHYEALLAAILAEPDAAVDALPMLPAAESEAIAAFAGEDAELPAQDVVAMFEEAVDAAPAAVAVSFGGREWSYAELDARANRLAHWLRAQGVGAEVRVGVRAERSPQLPVALLAILKAGGVYVPLDPAYPPARLAFIRNDAGLALELDLAAPEPAGFPATRPTATAAADDAAYVIYTSGSTGEPKGVVTTRRGLPNMVCEARRWYGLGRHTRFLQFASPSFDASVLEMLVTLCSAGTLVMAEREALLPGPALAELCERERVDTINMPPSALAALPPPTTVRTVIAAGEACPPALAERWARRCRVFNAYGPTEATVWSTVAEYRVGEGRVPIGRPIANTRVWILDARGTRVPVGVAGELWIGGIGLARGYHARPALTAERFVDGPEGRRYRTGDRARWLPDGRIEFLGRSDHQLKVRGFRIEPGEIEAALAAHAEVREALVAASDDALTAWLVPAAGAATAQIEQARLAQWRRLYEQSPLQATGDDFRGWNSAFDGQPLPEAEMRGWRDATVARILALGPRRVYEIGCGGGLLASRIAPRCEAYWASDFAAPAVAAVEALGLPGLRALACDAADFSAIPEGGFDTVVLNSVVQYFPSAEHLRAVLAGAVRALAPGGRIFVGDVRNLAWLPAYHLAIARARGATDPQAAAAAAIAREEELCLDPGFWATTGLDVELLEKDGPRNELAEWRYDVVLRPATRPGLRAPERLRPVPGAPLANQPVRGELEAALVPRLRAWLAERLPEHMLPARWVVLAAFPLTPNGKIDRAALPAPARDRRQAGAEFVAPRTADEQRLSALFAESLGLERVGAHDDFFELGGHSLLAVQLVARLRERTGIELPLRALFEAPTPAALARLLPAGARVGRLPDDRPAPVSIPKAPPGAPRRLSAAQELWFTLFPARAELEHGVQNSYAAIRLEGPLDVVALERALALIVERHEPLRTTFTDFERRPRRVVHERIAFALAHHDAASEAEALVRLQDAAEAPFDLAAGPLVRAGVWRLGPSRALLMFSASHLVFDGWSLKILLAELDEAYAAFAAGRTPALPALPTTYSDFAHWQRGWLRREVLGKQLLYWLRQGRGMPVVLELPTDMPRPATPSMRGASVVFELPPGLVARLDGLARDEGVTPYMLMLAAFQVLLHRFSGRTDVFVGTPVANRPLAETHGLVGLFVNFVVLRGDMSDRPSFRAYLARVRQTCLGAYANQDLPFQVLLKAFKLYRTLTAFRGFRAAATARSNVMFNMVEDFAGELSVGALRATLLPLPSRHASQTLHLILVRAGGGITGHLIYAGDMFRHETAERLARDYEALLASVLADPTQPVDGAAVGGLR